MLNKIKLLIVSIGALLITGGALVGYDKYKDYLSVKNDLAASNRNELAYLSIINKDRADMRVLELTASNLRNSNNKMINYIDSVRKSVRGAENKPGDVSGAINTSINTSGSISIYKHDTLFVDTIIKPNKFTEISLKIEKDSLKYGITINNTQTLLVYSSREYVNSYSNKWNRFWHFDWKKEDVTRYDIRNSNELIKNGDIIIYKIR